MGPGRAADRLFDAVIIQRDDDMTITNCTAGVGIGYESVFDGRGVFSGQAATRGTCTE